MCFPGSEEQDPEGQAEATQSSNPAQRPSPRFQWTEALQQNFREELEKLVILDYMMRNTGTTTEMRENITVTNNVRSGPGQLDD